MNNYGIEEQQDGYTIDTIDYQPLNNIFNDKQVCIDNLSTHQSFVSFEIIIKIEIHTCKSILFVFNDFLIIFDCS